MPVERIWMLLGKKKSGEATRQELEELEILLTNYISSIDADEMTNKIWNVPLESFPPVKAGPGVWQNIEDRISTRTKRQTFIKTIQRWSVAAAILLLVSATLFYNYAVRTKRSSNENTSQIDTKPGSKLKIRLPDGTLVWLNGNSHLDYVASEFPNENREVTLVGEAFFDVVKNEKLPFVIHTGAINITVKGTAFNVKAYPNQPTIETALIRGVIEITTRQAPDRKIILKPNEKIVIPVEQETSPPGKIKPADSLLSQPLYAVLKLNAKNPERIAETSWLDNKLDFNNETFEELVPRLESWFNVRIHLQDDALKKKRFSGLIERETIQQTLEALTRSFAFTYTIGNNEVFINKK
ncbi:MAG: FecR family protein [Chitinophagaceae bacterium]